MPFAYPHRQHLKQAILARVAGGERLKTEVCASPGMPDYVTVYLWGRDDPAFAAELREARRVADWRRRFVYDEAKARAVIARLAAGETLRQVIADPAMPSRRTLAYWRNTQVDFAEAMQRVKVVRGEAWRFRNHGRFRAFDAALADRVLVRVLRGEPVLKALAADPDLPSPKVFDRWRRENGEYDRLLKGAMAIGARNRRRIRRPSPRCTDELMEVVMERIIHGATVASLGRDADMPSRKTLQTWKRDNPEFARALAIARQGRDDLRDDKRELAARAAWAKARARPGPRYEEAPGPEGAGGSVVRGGAPARELVGGGVSAAPDQTPGPRTRSAKMRTAVD